MMRPTLLAILFVISATTLSVRADDPPADEKSPRAAADPTEGDAPLPEGFPDPTAPGVVEVKQYPAYRSAKVEGEGMSLDSGDFLFWPLFRHISRKDIAMTAPVINTYDDPKMLSGEDARGKVAMEFLYRRPDQGETGADGNLVDVQDHPAAQFVCLGYRGRMSEETIRKGYDKLQTWLSEHEDEWKTSGPPRRLGYNGPMTPEAERNWEIQIPIEPADSDASKSDETDKPA